MSDHFFPVNGLIEGTVPRPEAPYYRAPRRGVRLLVASAAVVVGLSGGAFVFGQLTPAEHERDFGTSQSAAPDGAAPAPAPGGQAPAPAVEGQEHESD